MPAKLGITVGGRILQGSRVFLYHQRNNMNVICFRSLISLSFRSNLNYLSLTIEQEIQNHRGEEMMTSSSFSLFAQSCGFILGLSS